MHYTVSTCFTGQVLYTQVLDTYQDLALPPPPSVSSTSYRLGLLYMNVCMPVHQSTYCMWFYGRMPHWWVSVAECLTGGCLWPNASLVGVYGRMPHWWVSMAECLTGGCLWPNASLVGVYGRMPHWWVSMAECLTGGSLYGLHSFMTL